MTSIFLCPPGLKIFPSIFRHKKGVHRAFRNLPGVETACVDRLNLLTLAPGGHMGRFCVWTQVRKCTRHDMLGSRLATLEFLHAPDRGALMLVFGQASTGQSSSALGISSAVH